MKTIHKLHFYGFGSVYGAIPLDYEEYNYEVYKINPSNIKEIVQLPRVFLGSIVLGEHNTSM